MKLRLGHHVFGLAAIAFGVITLNWHQIVQLGNISHREILVYIAGIVELIGGFAIQWQRTVRYGALILAAVFSIFSLYWIPQIIKVPLSLGYYGNFGEQFSIVIGGVFVFASTISSHPDKAARIERAAYICFGICVISYALYQLFYLTYTASLVPKWIPPGQMFWAVATTIAFALAAFAILSGRSALLASRLLTTMLIGFGVLIWVPACAIHPHDMSNWVENASNLAMVGSAWIVV
ncbi:MAG TPA: hypothetical protein PL001_06300, partial [Candidatus Kryptobacter bacterium]|nr:hypothetical protein [Candidatus Kryptobacter bacterium]